MTLDEALKISPIVAILRGILPEETLSVVEALYEAGIRAVEVPLNSPEPLKSIAIIAENFETRMLVGAGTVTSPEDVAEIAACGGKLIVSPNVDVKVIDQTLENGLLSVPGFATATEAFAALASGAHALKLFPAATYGLGHVKALRAVLPRETVVLAVGGVNASNMPSWMQAGASGFGLGSELFAPGMRPDNVYRKALLCVKAIPL